MPPKPLRAPTRRTSVALPQTQQLNFLLEASALFSASSPQLAAVLGRKALLVGDGEHVVMPRGAAASMCAHCGLPFTADVYQSGQVIKLPRQYIRRRLQASSSGGVPAGAGKQVNRAAVVYCCQLCGHSTVRPFYTAAAAQQAVLKAGGNPPPLPAQQAAPLSAAGAPKPSTVATPQHGSAVPSASCAARCGVALPAAPVQAAAEAAPPSTLPMLGGEGLPATVEAAQPTCPAEAQALAATIPAAAAAPAETAPPAVAAPPPAAAVTAAAPPCLTTLDEAAGADSTAQPAPAQLEEGTVPGAAQSGGGDGSVAAEQAASGAAEASGCLPLVKEDVEMPPPQAAAPQGTNGLPMQLEQPRGEVAVDSEPSSPAAVAEEPAAAADQPLQLLGPAAAAALQPPHEDLSAQPAAGPAPQQADSCPADSGTTAAQQEVEDEALAVSLPVGGVAQQAAEQDVQIAGSHETEPAAVQQEVAAAAEQCEQTQPELEQCEHAVEEELPAAALAAVPAEASPPEGDPLGSHLLASVDKAASAEADMAVAPPAAQQSEEGDEGESPQEPPRKRRRISWRQELEDVQLISPVPGAGQAGEGGSAWSPVQRGGVGRRRVWFRVGRSWKMGTLLP